MPPTSCNHQGVFQSSKVCYPCASRANVVNGDGLCIGVSLNIIETCNTENNGILACPIRVENIESLKYLYKSILNSIAYAIVVSCITLSIILPQKGIGTIIWDEAVYIFPIPSKLLERGL